MLLRGAFHLLLTINCSKMVRDIVIYVHKLKDKCGFHIVDEDEQQKKRHTNTNDT